MLNPTVFRNYDIRGIVPDELTELSAEEIGKAFGTLVQSKYGKNIVVGHDNRKTSAPLKDKFVYGLMSTGCNVTDIGLSLTPIIEFLTFEKEFDAGVIVTASHNPKQFNGFRFCGTKADPLYGNSIQEIKSTIDTQNYKKSMGSVTYEDLSEVYVKYMVSNFQFNKRHRVIVDCGNGTSSVISMNIFERLNLSVVGMYCNLDGDYPHGTPDPESNLFMQDLAKEVLKQGKEIGIAYDTDGDRFGLVDEKGTIYSNDKMLLLFGKYMLKDNPGASVIYDVKCTALLEDKIKEFGGVPIMMRTGHPYFIERMKGGALLGGEFSGHIYFSDKYMGFDDGIYASLRVIEILDKEDKSLSELMSAFPKMYHTEELKYPCNDNEKEALIEKIREVVKSNLSIVRVDETDGIRAYLNQNTWFLVRASNTSPYLSLRFESQREKDLNDALIYIEGLLPKFQRPLEILYS
ncbi:MAG: phosphomannomutase/phosphoglucomutase [Patescibacteria group bacterium]